MRRTDLIEAKIEKHTYATIWDIRLGQSLFALGRVWFAWVGGHSKRLELADGMRADQKVKKREMVTHMFGYALEGIGCCLPFSADLNFYLDRFVNVL